MAKPKSIAQELEYVADLLGQCLDPAYGPDELGGLITEALEAVEALRVVV